MFASWKPVADSDGSDVYLSKRPHTFDPVTARTQRPVACSQCRAQKVRCTGERSGKGCKRCQTLRRKCTYAPRPYSTVRGDEAPGSRDTDTELWHDPLELPTPSPTEDRDPASTNHAAYEWIHESQEEYSGGMDFSNFQLDHEITPYSAVSPKGNCDDQSERFVPEQTMATQEPSLFRSPQHPEIYSGVSEPAANCPPRASSRLPHAQGGVDTPRSSGSDCQCLFHVVFLMDELELLGGPTDAHLPVDGILVAHRKALHQAEGMLACVSCVVRVENMIILSFLVSRLTDLCCRAMSAVSSPPTADHQGTSETPATVVGSYRLESETEHIAVVRVLLRLGLDRLLGLVSALQGVGRRLGSEVIDRRLGVCRRAIKDLVVLHNAS
ncbi:hypothetical protein GGR54DRAFT_626397 [Hypoxylon sp. NC1633]|nr:hypothetical protein GGR54DRAFT_626397 [Hypoxylon sp. NC1633]